MYQRKLDQLSEQAISRLQNLLAVPIVHGVDEAHLEVFLDECGAPSVWVYWRGKNNKVDNIDPHLFPGRSLELELGLGDLADIDEQYFVASDAFPGLRLAASLLSRWLAESWWKAGGWAYPVPTTLAVHDAGASGRVQLSKGIT
ncbi:MAG: hypothetical protein QM795_14025 [Pseudoxanthomonas sp.]